MYEIEFKQKYIQLLPAGLRTGEIIYQLAQPLVDDDLVVSNFAEHVLKREENFPTGLPTQPIGVAIPHTDHKYVHRNAIAMGILSEPVLFEDMGGESESVPVRIIFMLALSESNKQLNALGWIMEMIQDSTFMESLLNMKIADIYSAVSQKMTERGEI